MNEKSKMETIGISSFSLKWIAILTMIIDHVGYVLFPQEIIFRKIGRIAFPIFCFLLVEGYFHTKNVYRYAGRLFLFALLSEVPFDLALFHQLPYYGLQNVFFTLILGLILIWICERIPRHDFGLSICTLILIMMLADFLKTDYSYFGIFMIYLFYFFRGEEISKRAGMVISQALLCVFLASSDIEKFALISLIPIMLYNGEKGYGKLQYLFYFIYPLHLLVLYLIS